MRDDFTQATRDILANRVGWRCSNPGCRKMTRGAGEEGDHYINIGVAAHICAASEGGPRYDIGMSAGERKSIANGIWLCQTCSKLIDSDTARYTVERLNEWKSMAERMAAQELEVCHNPEKQQERIMIINSFLDISKCFEDDESIKVDLAEYFDGRFLKAEYGWEKVVDEIKHNLRPYLTNGSWYCVKLSAHFSIAFMAGRIMNPKSGIKTTPVQNTINGSERWDLESPNPSGYEGLSLRKECLNDKCCDVALVVSITRDIEESVKGYILDEKLPIGELYDCGFKMPSIDSIVDGKQAWEISKQINHWVEERSLISKKGMLHIFIASPLSIMFFLGKMSLSYGEGIIYEYDYEHRKSGTYFPALKFSEGDWM